MELLARHASSDLVAFGAGGARTAAALTAYVHAIARALGEAPRGARVVIAVSDRYRFAAALLGVWQRGLVAVLPHNGQPETVRSLARTTGVAALLHDRDEDVGLDVRTLESEALHATPPVTLGFSAQDRALVAYTSGSTGVPVAHDKTLSQLVEEPRALIEAFGLARRRIVTAVPPHHIYGLLFGVLVPLLGGGSMSRSSPLQPSEVLRELSQHGADVLVVVPPHLAALAAYDAEPARWPALHAVISSAAPLPEATDRALLTRGVTVTQVLGSTETGGIAFRTSTDAAWTPLPHVRVGVAEDGALEVASPWATPSGSEAVRTADRVELVPLGFRHIGRVDGVVKVGGRRVDVGELEMRLRALPAVRDARVLAVDSARMRGTELCVVVEADPQVVTATVLRDVLAPHLDPVVLPRRYRVVPRLPRTAAGKVTRRELEALFDTFAFPRELEGEGHVRFTVPANSVFFRGHFDGQPILPGVVQLQHLALAEARRRWPDLGGVSRVTRVKFKRPIAPGDELVLELSRRGDTQVHFAMRCGDEPASSGIFHFGGAAR